MNVRSPREPPGPRAERLRRWHRLFGLLLNDQLLNVVVVRRRRGRLTRSLPDGLNDLAELNLISFKSFWEALTDWASKR